MKNLEKMELDMVQLDTINGGGIGQVANDSKLLHDLGLNDEILGDMYVTTHWDYCSAKIDEAWAKIGITCVSHCIYDNEYFYQGRSITWEEAKKIAKNLMIKGPRIA